MSSMWRSWRRRDRATVTVTSNVESEFGVEPALPCARQVCPPFWCCCRDWVRVRATGHDEPQESEHGHAETEHGHAETEHGHDESGHNAMECDDESHEHGGKPAAHEHDHVAAEKRKKKHDLSGVGSLGLTSDKPLKVQHGMAPTWSRARCIMAQARFLSPIPARPSPPGRHAADHAV